MFAALEDFLILVQILVHIGIGKDSPRSGSQLHSTSDLSREIGISINFLYIREAEGELLKNDVVIGVERVGA